MQKKNFSCFHFREVGRRRRCNFLFILSYDGIIFPALSSAATQWLICVVLEFTDLQLKKLCENRYIKFSSATWNIVVSTCFMVWPQLFHNSYCH